MPKNNINKKDINAATKIAHDIAKNDFSSKDAKTFMDTTNANMRSTNNVVRATAQKAAAEFTSKLALLLLYQEIETDKGNRNYEWPKFFEDTVIAEGNSKQFIKNIKTGANVFSPNDFVPTKITSPQVEAEVLSMYIENPDGTRELAPNAYQFKKSLTIQQSLWLPYFQSGKLGEYIALIKSAMRDTYDDYVVATAQTFITTKLTFNKNIVDTTNKNMFTAFSNGIIPNLKRMQFRNSEYKLGTTAAIDAALPEDTLLFINANNLSKLQSGVESITYNAKLFELESVLPKDNLIGTAGAIVVGNEDTPISVGADWIDEKTIYVLTKRALRHCLQIDRAESQSWANNLTIEMTLHIWGTWGSLPWENGFKYTNENLNVLPSDSPVANINVNTAAPFSENEEISTLRNDLEDIGNVNNELVNKFIKLDKIIKETNDKVNTVIKLTKKDIPKTDTEPEVTEAPEGSK